MALMELTRLKQIELFSDPVSGGLAHIFAERVNQVSKDGVVIAETNHRESFTAGSPEAVAILGEVLSAALVSLESLKTENSSLKAIVASIKP